MLFRSVGLFGMFLLLCLFHKYYTELYSTIIHIDESNIKLIRHIRKNSNQLATKYYLNQFPTLLTRSPGTVFQKYKVWGIQYKFQPRMHGESTSLTMVEIKIGDRTLQISGDKEDLSWLAKELSYYLEVPLQ